MDLRHFVTVSDPRIRTTDLRIWGSDFDPEPDLALIVSDLQDANNKLIFSPQLFCLLLFEGTFASLFKLKIKNRKEVTK